MGLVTSITFTLHLSLQLCVFHDDDEVGWNFKTPASAGVHGRHTVAQAQTLCSHVHLVLEVRISRRLVTMHAHDLWRLMKTFGGDGVRDLDISDL
jgi:hypothetical protein